MVETQLQPVLGIEETFPDRLYLLYHPTTQKYGCYRYEGIDGLACFSTESAAFRFAEWIDLSGLVTCEVDFDEAREIAKARPLPVVSLMLLDSLQSPRIHFVR